MRSSMICCALMGAVLLSSIDYASSECCHVPLKCTENSKSVERCYDCTEATVYCGKGKCNLLGCNCDNGCRQGDSSLWCWNIASGCKGKYFYEKLFSITEDSAPVIRKVDPKDLFVHLDKDNNQRLDRHEITKYVMKSNMVNVNIDHEFNKMDINGDGFLTLNEIDQ